MENTALKNYILDLENYLKLKGAETHPFTEMFKSGVIINEGVSIDLILANCTYTPGQEIYLESAESNVTFKLDDYTIESELTGTIKVKFTENRPPTLAERVTTLEGKIPEPAVWETIALIGSAGTLKASVANNLVSLQFDLNIPNSMFDTVSREVTILGTLPEKYRHTYTTSGGVAIFPGVTDQVSGFSFIKISKGNGLVKLRVETIPTSNYTYKFFIQYYIG